MWRFAECRAEKDWSLIRYDIVCSLRNVFDTGGDEGIRATALELIDSEDDVKYRSKYAGVWRSVPATERAGVQPQAG